MKLRKTIQRQIIDALDSTFFTADDFVIDFDNEKGSGTLIEIDFAHDHSFSFKVYDSERSYFVEVRPGKIADEDNLEVSSIEEILNAISNWANEVRHELKAIGPQFEKIESLKKYVKEHIQVDDTGDEFSVNEINELRKKFKELEGRVVKLEQDKIITETQLKAFQDGVRQISSDVEYYPKKTWLKTAPNKLVQLVVAIGKSSEGRKVIADGARKLLGLE